MEERKGEDGEGGNGCRNMSVVVMGMSQYVSRCDRTPLSGGDSEGLCSNSICLIGL